MGIRRHRTRPATTLIDPWLERVMLAAIAEHGCGLQDRASAVLVAAAEPGAWGAGLAREGGYLAGEYYRLFGWASDIATDPIADREGAAQAQELVQVLMYHCQVLHDSIRLAFPKYLLPGDQQLSLARVGISLGEPARRLRELTTELGGQA